MSKKDCTIVIPSFNHEAYIENCLYESSKIKRSKILVIDDGSTDKTVSLVRDFINKNPSVELLLIQKENSGLVSSLNISLDYIDTEFCYFCASDDIPVPEGVDEALNFLKQRKEFLFFMGNGFNFFEDKAEKSFIYKNKHIDFFDLRKDKMIKALYFNPPSPILLQTVVFRASVFKKVGGWDSDLKWDDFPFFVKLFNNLSKESYYFNFRTMIVKYRHHNNNTYKNLNKQINMYYEYVMKVVPHDIRFKVLSKKSAFYFWKSIIQMDWSNAYLLLRINKKHLLFFSCSSFLFEKSLSSIRNFFNAP